MALENALLIFIKNPVLGKVKTRLAKTVGDANALKVYHYLLANIREVISEIDVDKLLFYNSYIPTRDEWSNFEYQKFLQKGDGLGAKMKNAFQKAYDDDYENVVLISPDCPKLRTFFVEKAFQKLLEVDVVLGPTEDGGYYLIGMKKVHNELFENKEFGTGTLFEDTLKEVEKLGLTYFVFPKLLDVDTEEDLGKLSKLIKK